MLKIKGYTVKAGEILELEAKTGIDGSGSHKIRHQLVDSSKSLEENPYLDPEVFKNYILACCSPLALYSLKGGVKTEIWKNPTPNSIAYTRPLSLVRAEESREVLENEFAGLFDNIMNIKSQVMFVLCYFSEFNFIIEYSIRLQYPNHVTFQNKY